MPTIKRVLVTGDVALDVNIYHGKRPRPWTQKGPGTETVMTPGGVFLRQDIIEALSRSGRSEEQEVGAAQQRQQRCLYSRLPLQQVGVEVLAHREYAVQDR